MIKKSFVFQNILKFGLYLKNNNLTTEFHMVSNSIRSLNTNVKILIHRRILFCFIKSNFDILKNCHNKATFHSNFWLNLNVHFMLNVIMAWKYQLFYYYIEILIVIKKCCFTQNSHESSCYSRKQYDYNSLPLNLNNPLS